MQREGWCVPEQTERWDAVREGCCGAEQGTERLLVRSDSTGRTPCGAAWAEGRAARCGVDSSSNKPAGRRPVAFPCCESSCSWRAHSFPLDGFERSSIGVPCSIAVGGDGEPCSISIAVGGEEIRQAWRESRDPSGEVGREHMVMGGKDRKALGQRVTN